MHLFKLYMHIVLHLLVFLFIKVFSIISSCVRVDIDGVKSVHNSGQAFMIPSGKWKLKSDLMKLVFTYY